jgi:microcystin-dependent protein
MNPFIGQISIAAFGFTPRYWAPCDGATMAINQNQALFAILGTTYGGDGVTTFKLPDLRGRAALHPGTVNPLGTLGGAEVVTLTAQQIPSHTHVVNAVSAIGTLVSPANSIWAASEKTDLQYGTTTDTTMSSIALDSGGEGQPHENMHPSLVVNFIIALSGIFPSRN